MSLIAMVQLMSATASSHTPSTDPLAPIFHISPAQCHGGWTNDPNGALRCRRAQPLMAAEERPYLKLLAEQSLLQQQ
jgi:hypothetical protein